MTKETTNDVFFRVFATEKWERNRKRNYELKMQLKKEWQIIASANCKSLLVNKFRSLSEVFFIILQKP